MKEKFALLVILFATALFALSQTTTCLHNVYAYKQASTPGVRPVSVDDSGNPVTPERKQTFNYWFYIEYSPQDSISVKDIWISGKRFHVKAEPVTVTPVIKLNYAGNINPDTIRLVPSTGNKVILIYPSGENINPDQYSKKMRAEQARNELVIGFQRNGKNYFTSKKSIRVLDPEIRQ